MARVCLKRGVVVTAAWVVGVCGLVGGAQADQVRIVALAGQPLPGGNGQNVNANRFAGFANASIPMVSESGHVLFTAEVTGTGVTSTNNRGLWRADANGNVSLVARLGSGAWAPATGLTFSALSTPMINADGMCAFLGTLAGTGVTTTNSKSYWCFNGGPAQLLVREAEDAVGFGTGIDLGTITEPEWMRSSVGGGLLVFKSTLLGTGVTTTNNRALWVDSIGTNNCVALARAGFALDEFPTLTCREPYRTTSRSGQALLFATLTGSGIVTSSTTAAVVPNDQVIWFPGASRHLVRAGEAAPGAASGVRFASLFTTTTTIRRPQLNSSGHVLFSPTLCSSTGVAVGSGLWTNRDGTMRPVVKSGDAAPGLPGVVIGTPVASVPSSGFPHALAENGDVVFASILQGSGVSYANDRAIFRSRADGTTELIARGGQQVPGAPAGLVITNDSIARCWRVNANGEVAFIATLSGPGVTDVNDVGVFVTLPEGLRMVAREGDVVPESGGWVFSSTIPEPAMYFNGRNQLLFPSNASGGPTGGGSSVGWFRVDETGAVRALTLGLESTSFAGGSILRVNPMLSSSPLSFSDQGQVVFANNLLPGTTVNNQSLLGAAVVAITIEPVRASVPTTGACCRGSQCTVVEPTGCAGAFQGAGSACDFPSNPVTCCPANFNRINGVDLQDLFDYLGAFFAGTSAADMNASGVVSVEDVFIYMQLYHAGCP